MSWSFLPLTCKRSLRQSARTSSQGEGKLQTCAEQGKLQRQLSSHGLVSGPQVNARAAAGAAPRCRGGTPAHKHLSQASRSGC